MAVLPIPTFVATTAVLVKFIVLQKELGFLAQILVRNLLRCDKG